MTTWLHWWNNAITKERKRWMQNALSHQLHSSRCREYDFQKGNVHVRLTRAPDEVQWTTGASLFSLGRCRCQIKKWHTRTHTMRNFHFWTNRENKNLELRNPPDEAENIKINSWNQYLSCLMYYECELFYGIKKINEKKFQKTSNYV